MTEQDLFVAALQINDRAERSAYLNRECGDDTRLRQRLQVLLRAHAEAADFLESPPTGSYQSTSPPAETAGSMIGPYKLLQLIGEGGMGAVFMAEQEQPVRRRVAIKVIKPGMDTGQVISRFEAERQALALMDHPNIAKVLEAGTTPAGRPFFVMELVKGMAITKFCDENRLTPRERLELFVPVCQAIQHAHQKGIIHRDVKPSNVLVTLHDGAPVPMIIDFGVAKALHQKLTEKTMFTAFGQMVGTLEYMAPEQAAISGLDVDTRSDVYSLGVLLYELLTGTTPLTHQRLREAAFDEVLRLIREEEPPKPSTRLSDSREGLASIAAQRKTEPARLTRLVRGELDWIVMKALEKDRARRYETANAFARDVQRYLSDEAVEACPPSAAYRLRKLAQRHRGALLTAAAVAALLAVAAAVSIWQAVQAKLAEAAALAARDAEAEQRRRARAALDDMLSEESLAFLTTQRELLPPQRAFLERALRYYREFADQAAGDEEGRALEAKAQLRVGRIYDVLGQRAEAEAAYRSALALHEKLAAEYAGVPLYRAALAGIHNLRGHLLAVQGKLADAEPECRAALTLDEKLVADHPDVPQYRAALAASHDNLSNVLADQGKRAEAEAECRAALVVQETLAADHPVVPQYRASLATSHNNLGILLKEQGKKEEAEAEYRAALVIQERLVADNPGVPQYRQELARSHYNLGNRLADEDKFAETEAAYRASLVLYEKLAADYPGVPEYRRGLAGSHYNLAGLLADQGKRAEAESEYRAALTVFEKLAADNPRVPAYAAGLGGSYSDLGTLVSERGEPAAALDWYAKAIATLGPVHRANPRLVDPRRFLRNSYGSRAVDLARLGRPAEAVADFDRALALDNGSKGTALRVGRVGALARAGEATKALAAADELAGADQLTAGQHYDLTCVYALAAARLPPADADRAAAKATAALRQAIAAGYRDFPHVLKDDDLAAIRGLDDFAALLWDWADTPAKP
jgi:serine/threonine protein kinase